MSSVIVECPLTNDQSMTVMILQEYLENENDEVFDVFQAAIR